MVMKSLINGINFWSQELLLVVHIIFFIFILTKSLLVYRSTPILTENLVFKIWLIL